MRYPIGTCVEAVIQIDDVDPKGNTYTHAHPGDRGVIIAYYCEDDAPTIDWGVGAGFGVYDSPPSDWRAIPAIADCL
jgi:hypothetical protein